MRLGPIRFQNSLHRYIEPLVSLESLLNLRKFGLPPFRCGDQYTANMSSAWIVATGPRCYVGISARGTG
jgi:hypothetical protein